MEEKSSAYPNFRDVIARAPGPSPWYLLSSGPQLKYGAGDLQWVEAGDTGFKVGKVFLSTPRDEVLAVFNFHCYVLGLDDNQFLVWLPYEKADDNSACLKLLIFKTDELEVIDDVPAVCEEMNKDKIRSLHIKGKPGLLEISRELEAGLHPAAFPASFKEIEELLILAHSIRRDQESGSVQQMNLSLFILKPGENTVTVVPQDWFNTGPYDFGFQWPARIARDPRTGKIFGEGIHLGFFVLDETGREFEQWVKYDPAHKA